MRPMLATGYSMLASRAYTHQYEAYGLSADDFQHCFAVAEDVLGSYAGLG
jgi:tubulin delta